MPLTFVRGHVRKGFLYPFSLDAHHFNIVYSFFSISIALLVLDAHASIHPSFITVIQRMSFVNKVVTNQPLVPDLCDPQK